MKGKQVPAILSETFVTFDYDLPKDRFRIPYMARKITITLPMSEMPAFSWNTYVLVEGPTEVKKESMIQNEGRIVENQHVRLEVQANGTLTLQDKVLGEQLDGLLTFEDVGDIGNEYIFKQPEND